MIEVQMDIDMPKMCYECPFCILHGGCVCAVSQSKINDDNVFVKRPAWCKLQDSKKMSSLFTFKTQLSDGHVHLTAHDRWVHNMKTSHEKQRIKLKKYANNPGLSEDLRSTLYWQVFYLNLLDSYMGAYEDIRKQVDELKKKVKR